MISRFNNILSFRLTAQQVRYLLWEGAALVVALPLVVVGTQWALARYWIGVDRSDVTCLPWATSLVERSAPLSSHQAPPWARGDLVVVSAQGMTPFIKDGTSIGKLVVAISGDTVVISDQGIFVNEGRRPYGYINPEAIERADTKFLLPAGLPRRTASQFYRTTVVPAGHVFLMGSNPLSQDSRYFGPLPISAVKGRVLFSM